jgi:hypothetical protein
MHRGLRLLAAAAALTVVLDGALLVSRGGEGDDTAVLGASVERTTTTVQRTTTSSAAVPLVVADTTTSSVPILAETGATTSTTAARATTTTTTVASAPSSRQVTERSDNTASFTYGPGSGTPISVVDNDPADPFRFVVSAQDANQDGTAELKTELANQTQRDIGFPGGLVLRFNVAHDGEFWRTVELRFPDLQALPARGSLEIESAFQLAGPGRYDVVGETVVEYR